MANLGSDDTPVVGENFSLPAGASLDEEGGDMVIRDSAGNVVLRRDENAGAWSFDGSDVVGIEALNVQSASVPQVTSNVDFDSNDATGISALEAESVSTEVLHTNEAVASYYIEDDLTIPHDTNTDIDNWIQSHDEIGDLSDSQFWSPNNDGRYLVICQTIFNSLSGTDASSRTDVEGGIVISDAPGGNENRNFGDLVDHGKRTGYESLQLVDMSTSDDLSITVRQETGENESLAIARTKLEIIKVA